MDKNVQWEGGGMDVVIRLIDPEEELAEFLYQCDEYFEETQVEKNVNGYRLGAQKKNSPIGTFIYTQRDSLLTHC